MDNLECKLFYYQPKKKKKLIKECMRSKIQLATKIKRLYFNNFGTIHQEFYLLWCVQKSFFLYIFFVRQERSKQKNETT